MGRVKARLKKLNNFGVWWKSNPVLESKILIHGIVMIRIYPGVRWFAIREQEMCFFEGNDNLELKQRVQPLKNRKEVKMKLR